MPVSILLADNRCSTRQELSSLLTVDPNLAICGEADDATGTIQLVERLQPDILILNAGIPNLGELNAVHRLHNLSAHTQIILLSQHREESWVQNALRCGATAYVLRDCSNAELVRAVQAVASGHRFLGSPFYDMALETYISTKRLFSPDPSQMLDFELRNFYSSTH